MIKKILFATTNEGKIKEARQILGVEIEGKGMEIDEVQSMNPEEVAIKKANSYYEKLHKPIVIEDVSLSFQALNGLPGLYINDFSKALGNEGLVNLLKGEKNRVAFALTILVFVDEKGEKHIFKGEVVGSIAENPIGDKGFGWDPIFIPKGQSKTFAQMGDEKNNYSMRMLAFKEFKKWLDTI